MARKFLGRLPNWKDAVKTLGSSPIGIIVVLIILVGLGLAIC